MARSPGNNLGSLSEMDALNGICLNKSMLETLIATYGCRIDKYQA